MSTAAGFTYEGLVSRNLGFVTSAQQEQLRRARVFVCGVGGMGGACFLSLVRAGVGHIAMADIDRFELSNLNRQVFAFLDTVGESKTSVAARQARNINPDVQLEVLGAEWPHALPNIAGRYPIIVNGMDDLACGVHLYRQARISGATVVDAYTAPLPSVTVVRPQDPRPEERLGYPTVGKDWRELDDSVRRACLLKEIEYVLVHSSSHRHVDLAAAAEVAAGRRPRFSFSTMVITTGNLMAYEVIRVILGREGGADHRGYFFNPHDARVERPWIAPIAWMRMLLVRRMLRQLLEPT